MKSFDAYLFLLPSGAGGHAGDPERLRAAAEFQGYEGWLLGCRDRYERRGGSRGRLRVVVTPLATVGTPVGALAAALAAASALDGCDYVLAATADGA